MGRLGAKALPVVAVLFWFAGGAGSAGAITLSVLGPSSVNVNDSVTISLQVSGLTNLGSQSLRGYQLNLAYDSILLSTPITASQVAFGDPTNGGGGNALDISAGGVFGDGTSNLQGKAVSGGFVDLNEASGTPANLDSFQPGTFVLGTVTFTALAAGTATLDLCTRLVDPLCEFVDVTGTTLSFSTNGLSLIVEAPEPSAALLTVFGVVLLARARGRRSA